MKYLTIIRHAKSSWEHPDLDDFVRPLNDRGQTAIPLIGNYLQQQQIYPDLIISSPATRAIETAKGIA
nr:histidine phosphatase family protein [Chitinophagales bacterium]